MSFVVRILWHREARAIQRACPAAAPFKAEPAHGDIKPPRKDFRIRPGTALALPEAAII